MLTLSVSYLFAIFVTPVLARMSLKPNPLRTDSAKEGIGKRIAGFALQHSKIVVAGALILVIGSIISARRLEQQFFPCSDRNQMVIDLKLAEGSHLAFSESTLWPPLAFAMISGLMASTLLTLAVLPAAYRLVFAQNKKRIRTAKIKIRLRSASVLAIFKRA